MSLPVANDFAVLVTEMVIFLFGGLWYFPVLKHLPDHSAFKGAEIGGLCRLGLAGATSLAGALFSNKPRALRLIDSGHSPVRFVIAGVLLALWR